MLLSGNNAHNLQPVIIMHPSWSEQDTFKHRLWIAWFSCAMVCIAKVVSRDYLHYPAAPSHQRADPCHASLLIPAFSDLLFSTFPNSYLITLVYIHFYIPVTFTFTFYSFTVFRPSLHWRIAFLRHCGYCKLNAFHQQNIGGLLL